MFSNWMVLASGGVGVCVYGVREVCAEASEEMRKKSESAQRDFIRVGILRIDFDLVVMMLFYRFSGGVGECLANEVAGVIDWVARGN